MPCNQAHEYAGPGILQVQHESRTVAKYQRPGIVAERVKAGCRSLLGGAERSPLELAHGYGGNAEDLNPAAKVALKPCLSQAFFCLHSMWF